MCRCLFVKLSRATLASGCCTVELFLPPLPMLHSHTNSFSANLIKRLNPYIEKIATKFVFPQFLSFWLLIFKINENYIERSKLNLLNVKLICLTHTLTDKSPSPDWLPSLKASDQKAAHGSHRKKRLKSPSLQFKFHQKLGFQRNYSGPWCSWRSPIVGPSLCQVDTWYEHGLTRYDSVRDRSQIPGTCMWKYFTPRLIFAMMRALFVSYFSIIWAVRGGCLHKIVP